MEGNLVKQYSSRLLAVVTNGKSLPLPMNENLTELLLLNCITWFSPCSFELPPLWLWSSSFLSFCIFHHRIHTQTFPLSTFQLACLSVLFPVLNLSLLSSKGLQKLQWKVAMEWEGLRKEYMRKMLINSRNQLQWWHCCSMQWPHVLTLFDAAFLPFFFPIQMGFMTTLPSQKVDTTSSYLFLPPLDTTLSAQTLR